MNSKLRMLHFSLFYRINIITNKTSDNFSTKTVLFPLYLLLLATL